jgi:uncharacterized membrane protein YhhN
MGNTTNTFFVLAAVFAAAHSFFIWKKIKTALLPTKILTLVCLGLWAVLTLPPSSAAQRPGAAGYLWFLVGIVFCLAGDIFLEFSPEKWFKPGLLSFLLGQVCYVIGFNNLLPQGPVVVAATLAGLIAVLFVLVTRRMLRGLKERQQPKLRIPIVIYALCISLMLYSASVSLIDMRWNLAPAVMVSLGALSFYISDVMNAWARFVGPISNHRLKIMLTYHLAQLLIQAGIVIHFSSIISG